MIARLCMNRGEFLTNCVEIYGCPATSLAARPSRELMLHQSPNIHSLENQFYKNMAAKNDKILCVRYILYMKLSISLYKRLFIRYGGV